MPKKKPPAPRGKVLDLSNEELKDLLYALWDKEGISPSLNHAVESLRKNGKNVVIKHSFYYSVREKWRQRHSEQTNGAIETTPAVEEKVAEVPPAPFTGTPVAADEVIHPENAPTNRLLDVAQPPAAEEDELLLSNASGNNVPQTPDLIDTTGAKPNLLPRWEALAQQLSDLDALAVHTGGLANVQSILGIANSYDTVEKARNAFKAVFDFIHRIGKEKAEMLLKLYGEADKMTFAPSPVSFSDYDGDD